VETIKDVKIKDLNDFINSKEYQKFEYIPISFHRAVSYINNPRANKEDIAISLLYLNDKLIAYRCLYSDFFYYKEEQVDFAWISGSWVHPDFRRQGFSMKLLEHIMNRSAGKIMFSNYAPESKFLYDKSGFFSEVANLKGRRFYFRFSFFELLPPKHSFFKKIKLLLFVGDYFLNFYFDIRFLLYKNKTQNINFYENKKIDTETQAFIEGNNKNNPFLRNEKEINHALSFPWIIEKNKTDKSEEKYYFSSYAKRFKYVNIKVYDENSEISAFLLLKIRNNSMTIPYTFFEKNELNKLIQIIYFYIKKHRINHLTTYNSAINTKLLKQKRLILFSKEMQKKFFATNKIKNIFNKKNNFYAGDGDNLYT